MRKNLGAFKYNFNYFVMLAFIVSTLIVPVTPINKMIFMFLRVLPGVMFDLNNNMPSEVMIASTDEAIRKLCCRSGLKKVLE